MGPQSVRTNGNPLGRIVRGDLIIGHVSLPHVPCVIWRGFLIVNNEVTSLFFKFCITHSDSSQFVNLVISCSRCNFSLASKTRIHHASTSVRRMLCRRVFLGNKSSSHSYSSTVDSCRGNILSDHVVRDIRDNSNGTWLIRPSWARCPQPTGQSTPPQPPQPSLQGTELPNSTYYTSSTIK